ncbi:MAG: hypothetical protein ACRDLS_01980 [Solirubrobacteraceae bacterium]
MYFPDDPRARDRVARAWLEIGADYFGTLRAVVAKADAEAGEATNENDAMVRLAEAATKAAEAQRVRRTP